MSFPVEPPFQLYPEAQRWWSLQDYGAVIGVMQTLKPISVLEFGPGSSTLALIEGGATFIDTCEDNPKWAAVYRERLIMKFPWVRMIDYTYQDPLTIPFVDYTAYDFGLIDGPQDSTRRPLIIEYALQRCSAVLVPTEDYGHESESYLRPLLIDIAKRKQRHLEMWTTGPDAGGFALFT